MQWHESQLALEVSVILEKIYAMLTTINWLLCKSMKSVNILCTKSYSLSHSCALLSLTLTVACSSLYDAYVNRKSVNDKRFCWHHLATSFSIARNTKKLFKHSSNRVEYADSLILIFVLWAFIARQYTGPLYFGAYGLKRIFNTIPNELMTGVQYFWLRTPFPSETLITVW